MILKNQKSNFGKFGEDLAVKLLQNKGYKIVDRNFRSRFGEIDIIAVKGDDLIFIEVKTRWSLKFGLPEEAVTRNKLKKIIRTAEYYLITHPSFPKKMRVEVVAIEILNNNKISSKIISVDS